MPRYPFLFQTACFSFAKINLQFDAFLILNTSITSGYGQIYTGEIKEIKAINVYT